jgi:HTH-type transcriptional regulator/antitoxin HigA
MDIKPVKTKKDYQNALKRIEELWEAKPNSPEADELDILATLVEAYEAKNFSINAPDPVEAIKFRMEQLGLKQVDLAEYMGGKNRVSEVLNRKRGLTVKMIKNLNKHLNIPPESLLQ